MQRAPTASPRGAHPTSILRWHVVSYALIGFAAGLLVGLSESPVVSAILSLLLALITAGGGLYCLKADLRKQGTWMRMRLIGIGTTILALGSFASGDPE